MNKKQKRWRNRIIVALALFAVIFAATEFLPLEAWLGSHVAAVWLELVLFLVPYAIAGYDVLWKAVRNIGHGQIFDENFLMSIATVGAFAMVFFPDTDPHMAEGAAVMLFYQVGELFQSYAVGKSRQSISSMMDIAPDYANIEVDGALQQVDPEEVAVGDVIVVKPGERVPIDGTVIEGASQLDTAALTGESVPRYVEVGAEVVSGCINMTGALRVRTTKPFGESTVSRILELVENAASKKARTESFITRFARYYTPLVTGAALAIAVIPPLAGMGAWSDWILRGLTFLVVSCPCALVISVPLSFFGGIGGASKLGILVKGCELPGTPRADRDRGLRQDRHAHERRVQRGCRACRGERRPRPRALHRRACRGVLRPPHCPVREGSVPGRRSTSSASARRAKRAATACAPWWTSASCSWATTSSCARTAWTTTTASLRAPSSTSRWTARTSATSSSPTW